MSGPQCCENPPTLSSSYGTGHVEELGGLKSYVSGSPESKIAVLLVSDVYGYDAPNLRKLADKVAAAGFYVVVPDFLYGDPYAPENAERPLPVWIKDHGLVYTVLELQVFVGEPKVVVELAKYGNVQAVVLLHPSFVTLDDIRAVKVPISVLGAEIDRSSPPELLKQFEEALKGKSEVPNPVEKFMISIVLQVDGFVKIFPGVSHGWTVRYKDEDEMVVKCAEEAHKDMLDWFLKHLK
ncbi:alpha/beta-Hydrolases superfamily protein [Actinidia rufa]|uniref:Alpha/beta-Hydrolases superfamily protein n=1 Tax=Actinidia rufa TaxID=165716 RepID=A0A7J0HFH2_9ERIC|nr:alpha/beta-Hydrolases superfamily protein [Actinidia rufa]